MDHCADDTKIEGETSLQNMFSMSKRDFTQLAANGEHLFCVNKQNINHDLKHNLIVGLQQKLFEQRLRNLDARDHCLLFTILHLKLEG